MKTYGEYDEYNRKFSTTFVEYSSELRVDVSLIC